MPRIELDVDGERVVGDLWEPDAPPTSGILFVHGFNSCRKEFERLPARLAVAGHVCLAIDLRGHGESDGETGLLTLGRCLSDLATGADALAERLPQGAPLAVIGHSMGGAWAVAALARLDRFQAGVIVSPVNRPLDTLHVLERPFYHMLGAWNNRRRRRGQASRTIPYKNSYPNLFADQDAMRRGREIGFLAGKANLGCYDTLRDMDVSKWAGDVSAPVLVIGSELDKAVPLRDHRAVHAALAGPKALRVHDGGHSAFLDCDHERVELWIREWLDEHLAGSQ